MSDILIKIEDAAKFLGRSTHSVKDYAQIMESKGRKFLRGNKNDYNFSDEDINLIRKAISLQREEKLTKMEAIEHVLLESGDLSELPSESDKSTDLMDLSNMSKSMSDLSKAISDMSEKISDMALKMENLETQNIEQAKSYETKISELSNKLEAAEIGKLRNSMMEVKELIIVQQEAAVAKEQAAAAKKEENKKGFFSWLFGK